MPVEAARERNNEKTGGKKKGSSVNKNHHLLPSQRRWQQINIKLCVLVKMGPSNRAGYLKKTKSTPILFDVS